MAAGPAAILPHGVPAPVALLRADRWEGVVDSDHVRHGRRLAAAPGRKPTRTPGDAHGLLGEARRKSPENLDPADRATGTDDKLKDDDAFHLGGKRGHRRPAVERRQRHGCQPVKADKVNGMGIEPAAARCRPTSRLRLAMQRLPDGGCQTVAMQELTALLLDQAPSGHRNRRRIGCQEPRELPCPLVVVPPLGPYLLSASLGGLPGSHGFALPTALRSAAASDGERQREKDSVQPTIWRSHFTDIGLAPAETGSRKRSTSSPVRRKRGGRRRRRRVGSKRGGRVRGRR